MGQLTLPATYSWRLNPIHNHFQDIWAIKINLMRSWRRKVREALLPRHMVVGIAMGEAMCTVMVEAMAMSMKKKASNHNYIEVNAPVSWTKLKYITSVKLSERLSECKTLTKTSKFSPKSGTVPCVTNATLVIEGLKLERHIPCIESILYLWDQSQTCFATRKFQISDLEIILEWLTILKYDRSLIILEIREFLSKTTQNLTKTKNLIKWKKFLNSMKQKKINICKVMQTQEM